MRILFLSDDPHDLTVGAAIAPSKLQQALRALGHDCDCIFSESLGKGPQNERLRFLVSPWLAHRALRRAWRRQGPYDIIDAASAEGWLIARAQRRGAFPGAVVVARSHGLDHFFYQGLVDDARAGLVSKPWWRRWWYPLVRLSQTTRAFRFAQAAIVPNQRERAFLENRGWQPRHRIHVIPHGIDPARWAAAPAPDAPRGAGVLFSGAWYTGKGNLILAHAHRLLLERGHPVPLTVLGPGIAPLDSPRDFAAIARCVRAAFAPASQPWLTVLPRTADEEVIYAQYRRHDLLVCPSTAEGFGMVVFEALSQRLPVICTTAVGAAEWLRHAQTGWLVPPRDAPALADAIQRLWTDPDLRRSLAQRAHAFVHDFTWRRAAEATLAAYTAAGATSRTPTLAAAAGRK